MDSKEKQKRLASSIRKRRRELDVTQVELARALKFKNKATISKIEAGNYFLDWKAILLMATHLRDSSLLLQWWEVEKERLIDESKELAKPLAVMDKLFAALKGKGAFADIDK